jgi:hypothetical protein
MAKTDTKTVEKRTGETKSGKESKEKKSPGNYHC